MFLVLLIALFTAYNPRFLSARNVTNILTEVSIYGIIGIGMTYVILTGGIDLAVGSLLAFAAMCGAYMVQALGGDFTMSWFVALIVHVSSARRRLPPWQGDHEFNVPPFIVTLGGMTVWRGATLILNDG